MINFTSSPYYHKKVQKIQPCCLRILAVRLSFGQTRALLSCRMPGTLPLVKLSIAFPFLIFHTWENTFFESIICVLTIKAALLSLAAAASATPVPPLHVFKTKTAPSRHRRICAASFHTDFFPPRTFLLSTFESKHHHVWFSWRRQCKVCACRRSCWRPCAHGAHK